MLRLGDKSFCLLGYNAVLSVENFSTELQGVVTYKIEFFITTAVRI
jgi:hypothetical protein